MGERLVTTPNEMATTSTAVSTVSPPLEEEPVEPTAVITLRKARAQTRKKVVWTEDTVDNEHMNKKKSKCCCIYEKPRRFDESDSDSDEDECEHCFGHVEKRHVHKTRDGAETTTVDVTDSVEPTTTVALQPSPSPAPAPPDKQPASHTPV